MNMNHCKFKWMIAISLIFLGCETGTAPDFNTLAQERTSRVSTQSLTQKSPGSGETQVQRPHLFDAQERYVHFRGINVSGSHKAPPTEIFPGLYPIPETLQQECKE